MSCSKDYQYGLRRREEWFREWGREQVVWCGGLGKRVAIVGSFILVFVCTILLVFLGRYSFDVGFIYILVRVVGGGVGRFFIFIVGRDMFNG